MKASPQEIAAKWAQRAAAAQGDYASGIASVSQAPGQAAAAKAEKYRQGVTASVDKWRERTQAVSLSEWQTAAIQKGAPRFATGVSAAEGKMAGFLSEFGPHLDAVTAKVRGMPDTTPEQRIQRMVEQVRGTAAFRRRGSRG